MPLARIVTDAPDQVTALAGYLRSRGYTVEIIDPSTSRVIPADLELDLKGCSSDEAMVRGLGAAELASHKRRVIAYDLTGRPVAFADEDEEEEPAAKGPNAVAQAWNGLRSAGREMLENLRLSAGHVGEWLQEGKQTLREQRARSQEARRRAEEERQRERQERSQAEEEQQRSAEQERIRAQQAERARRQQEDIVSAREQAATQARLLREEEERRQEQDAERERRLLEEYRREARRDVVQERFSVEQSRVRPKIAPAEAVLAGKESSRVAVRRYHRDGDSTKAAVAAIVLAGLVTLGFAAYQNRRPASPLSNGDLIRSQSIAQPVPFGPATVAPTQLSTPPQTAQQAHPAVPNNKLPQADAAVPARAVAPPTAHLKKKRRSAHRQDDAVADDEVVVYHSGKPSQTRASSTTGPKHISDLEQ